MTRRTAFVPYVLSLLLSLGLARSADAQWYFAGYLGANTTRPATVSVDLPGSNLSLQFHEVQFEARPFESPQYYGWRLGELLGKNRRFGVEFEFIHLKVIAKTGAAYSTSGSSGSIAFAAGQQMRTVVERYSMTHGLNFLLGNFVVRQPIGSGRAQVILRGGAGFTVPHTETTVLGGAVDKYEGGGAGIHGAAGLNVQLRGKWSLVAEYKLSRARPQISIAGGGHGQMTALTHQVAAGVAFGLSR